jgi:hypothetical protein
MDIKDIINRVNKLDNKEKLHILNILKINGVDFTKNTNGYFFNLTNVDEEVVRKIVKCIELIETNRDLIRKIDKRREELLDYYKKIIQEKIDNNIKKRKNEYTNNLLLREIKTSIKCNIKRILKIKKKCDFKGDPDDMIKEYNKLLTQYEKDQVYYNIISKIKAYNNMKNDKKKEKIQSYDHISDFNDEEEDIDMDIDDEYIEDDLEVVEDIEVDEEEDDDLYYKDIDEEEENENDNENEIEIELDEEKDDLETETNMNFYKNLLNKKGFAFDNKLVLGYQEYIL